MKNSRRESFVFLTFFTPTLLWLLVFFLAPLVIIWVYSFSDNVGLTEIDTSLDAWSFDNYADIFVDPLPTVLLRTFWITGLSTLICLLIGFPVALVIATAHRKWKPWLLLVIILPFWTNLVIRAYALAGLLGRNGPVDGARESLWTVANDGLDWFGLGHLQLLGESYVNESLIGLPGTVVLGLVFVHLPFTVLPIYAALERLDRSYLEASLDLGAGQLRTFFSILLPMTAAGLAAAVIITFIPMLGSFLIPTALGRGNVELISNIIERQFKDANNRPFGAAISLLLLYLTFILLALQALAASRRKRGRHGAEA